MRYLLALLLMFPSIALALPAFPGAEGWGSQTPHGSGRHLTPAATTVYKVTNLNDSGTGSLRDCVSRTNPRICVFEVSGTIQLTSNMAVDNPYIWIAGETAPAGGIMLRNGELHLFSHDILVSHIRTRIGDDVANPGGPISSRHCITVAGDRGGAYNVVIDHFSGSWSVATCFNTWYEGNHDVTLSNSIIAEPLDDSYFGGYPPYTQHYENTNSLVGYNMQNISMIRNLLAHGRTRFPLIKPDSKGEFVNNVIFGWGRGGTPAAAISGPWYVTEVSDYQDVGQPWDSRPIFWDFVKNYYKPDTNSYGPLRGVYNSPGSPSVSGSKFFFLGNIDQVRTDDTLDDWLSYEGTVGSYKSLTRVASSGTLTERAAYPDNYNFVVASSGARISDADPIDTRVKNDVTNGIYRNINCVADIEPEGGASTRCNAPNNAGGWPSIPTNTRTLTVPANPNGDDDGDGYTNVEEWIHGYKAAVESTGTPSTTTTTTTTTAPTTTVTTTTTTTTAGATTTTSTTTTTTLFSIDIAIRITARRL